MKNATWEGGFCRSFKIANTGTSSSRNWKLTFKLPSSVRITDRWSGKAGRSGKVVTVIAPGWAAVVAPGRKVVAFGFCASGSGEPSAVSVAEVASTDSRPAASRAHLKARSRAAHKAAKKKIRRAKHRAARRAR